MADITDEHFMEDKFSPDPADIIDLDDEEFVRHDTQILNLEDGPEAVSIMPSTQGGDGIYFTPDSGDAEEEEDKELSPNGILDEETVAQGLTNLGRCADGSQPVFLHLVIPGYSLKDISILDEYVHLQKIEVPYNDLTDLSPLGHIPYLLELDASHNQVTSILDFTPPKNLKVVDLSFNNIDSLTDLSAHHYLQKLNLDNNHITEIKGLEGCGRLHHLSLCHNKIEKIQGLGSLPIRYLGLSYNELLKIENIEGLKYLQKIELAGNKIRSLDGLQQHNYLESIDLEDNEVIDLAEVQFVKNLDLLRELNLQRNPMRELPDYRLSVLFHLRRLTQLDKHRVEVDEKVSAYNMFNPSMEVIAARDHIMHVVYNFLQPSKILDSTLPSGDTPYPMLVLVGPQGAGKKDLALKLCEEFPDYFGYGIPHTTRTAHGEEVDGRDYHFTSLDDFEVEIKNGKFILTYAYNGELFGLSMDSIETVAKEGLACVVHMELEGVLTMKNTYFEPRYVLIMPLNRDSHERRLRERDMYTEPQIQWMLERSEMYEEYNREHPGFFDMFINSDDITDAYKRLRKLVMDYLGVSAPTPTASELDHENTDTNLLGRENTETTFATSANLGMGARTWSKHSLADSMSQAVANVKQRQAQSPIQSMARGIVEEQSLERRKSAMKEAVAGHRPTLFQQILKEKPATVPMAVTAQLGLGEADDSPSPSKDRLHSAPTTNKDNMDALPPGSPDSSMTGGAEEDTLSNISEAREIDGHRAGSPEADKADNLVLPQDTIERLELLSGSASKNLSNPSVPLAPRPGSREQQAQQQQQQPESPGRAESAGGSSTNRSGRPGSNRHPVLPPIGQLQDVM